MRPSLGSATICAAIIAIAFGTAARGAPYAAQLYPYCALSSASGATTCYYRSREECGSSCISNPWYIGRDWAQPGRRRAPHDFHP
jgi:hypothetical protein